MDCLFWKKRMYKFSKESVVIWGNQSSLTDLVLVPNWTTMLQQHEPRFGFQGSTYQVFWDSCSHRLLEFGISRYDNHKPPTWEHYEHVELFGFVCHTRFWVTWNSERVKTQSFMGNTWNFSGMPGVVPGASFGPLWPTLAQPKKVFLLLLKCHFGQKFMYWLPPPSQPYITICSYMFELVTSALHLWCNNGSLLYFSLGLTPQCHNNSS